MLKMTSLIKFDELSLNNKGTILTTKEYELK